MDFLVRRDDPRECRLAELDVGPPDPGQAIVRVDSFGLTANNITYAMFGEAMSYWDFFPARDGWGRVPVWGFGEVREAGETGLHDKARIFGYLPPSSGFAVTPRDAGEGGFVDAAPHRAHLPAAYNRYSLVEAMAVYDPRREAELMLLWPLFYTSFLLDDFLASEDLFGATTVVVSSASSKTALGAAFRLAQRRDIEVVGLTSAERVEFVLGTRAYDRVLSYDEVRSLAKEPTVYVDMSGDAAVRAAVHEHLGERLRHDAAVGATHVDRLAPGGASALPGPRPQFFFAPDQARRRTAEWGAEGLDARFAGAWEPFLEWAGGWLEIERRAGGEAVKATYLELLGGRADPAAGFALSP